MSDNPQEKKRASGQRPKKKRPPTNRFVQSKKLKTKDTAEEKAGPSTPQEPISASKRKIVEENITGDGDAESSGFRVFDIEKLFLTLEPFMKCDCGAPVKVMEVRTFGLSCKFQIECLAECGVIKTFTNSRFVEGTERRETEINRRFVYASQVLGMQYAGMEKLCGIMNLPPPFSRKIYDQTVQEIRKSVEVVAKESMQSAAKEEVIAEGSTDITISGDGSWQRRGFSSKNGVVTAIGKHTGKAIDVEVLTTLCHTCNQYQGVKEGEEYDDWKKNHEESCAINHQGSSGMMEVTGVQRIFARSIEQFGVRYKSYIGDGDSKTYSSVVKEQPYGPDFIPKKIECTAHIRKRMGTRLRNLKKSYRGGKKLTDGKPLGGAGRLTDKTIDKLASLYGNAIRSSCDVNTMKQKIQAIFHHYRSTDSKPEHHLCPKGLDSWCGFQKHKATPGRKKGKFHHRSSIPVAVMDAIEPVFAELSETELLERCVGGLTQNPNESLNSVIWKFVPKNVFCGRSVLETGVFSAVIQFNEGSKSYVKVLKQCGVKPGKYLAEYCKKADNLRISKAQRRSLDSTKEARKTRRQQGIEEREKLAQKEGKVYGSGAF